MKNLIKKIATVGSLALTLSLSPVNSYAGSKYITWDEESTMNSSSIKSNPLYQQFYELHSSFAKPREYIKNIDGLTDIAIRAYNGDNKEEFSNFIFASVIQEFLYYGNFYLDWDEDLLRKYPGRAPFSAGGFISYSLDRIIQTENEVRVRQPEVDENNNIVYEDVLVMTIAHKDPLDVSKIRWYKNINYEELEQYEQLLQIKKKPRKDWLQNYPSSFIETRKPVFEDAEAIIQLGKLAKKNLNKR